MTRAALQGILSRHGMEVDGHREGAGKFRDLEIGTGCDPVSLYALRADIILGGLDDRCVYVDIVDNVHHHQYGKSFLVVLSFWWA